MIKRENTTGKRFGRLIVLEELPPQPEMYGKYSGRRALVRCDCGIEKSVNLRAMFRGRILSCGCLQLESCTKHGKSKDRFYYIWLNIINRCYNKKHSLYKWYGGRGVGVCKEWRNSPIEFICWANSNWKPGLEIDRRNNNKGYFPLNCRFVSHKTNMNNTRNTVFLTIKDKDISLQKAAIKYNINPDTLRQRIKTLNWSHEKAVMTPVRARS